MIIVTDTSTGAEYEVLWESLVWFTQDEIDAMIEEEEGGSTDTADIPSDDIDISYTTAEPIILSLLIIG